MPISPIPPITLAQCQANNADVATPAGAGAPASDKPATSPGISGQTAPPAPIALASGQRASLEQLARSAVAALVEETSKPPGDQHDVEALRNEAICASEAYLKSQQVNPSGRRSLAYAYRLVGEAHGTTQLGLAQRADDIALTKYSILVKMTQGFESRLKDPESNPLTEQERQAVDRVIGEARKAAEQNVVAWKRANASNANSNPDARICVSGLASAEETRDLVSINAEKAEGFLRRLDQRALQSKIDSL